MSRTKPASASTCRCFVTAWRVISVPDVSCLIDTALPVHRTPIRRRRVSSPSAAKIGAEFASDGVSDAAFFEGALWRGDMFFNVLHLFVPAAAVHAECFRATRRRDIVKSGFDDGQ